MISDEILKNEWKIAWDKVVAVHDREPAEDEKSDWAEEALAFLPLEVQKFVLNGKQDS